jgi:NitT/TauT family transport system permease protein
MDPRVEAEPVAGVTDATLAPVGSSPGNGWRNTLWRLAILVSGFGIWEIAARMKWIDPYLISSPNAIAERLWSLARSGAMLGHIYVTAVETLLGFVIGAVLGVLLGMALALSPRFAVIIDPFVVAINGLPRVALAPLFVVWFGIGITSKVAVGASIVVFTCLFATYIGMRNTDTALLRAIKALGATNRQLLLKVQLPFSIPWIFAGLKTSVAMALIGAIIGEFIAAGRGVGWYIAYSGGQFDTTGVFAGLMILGAMAVALDMAVASVGKRLTHWKPDVAV